MGLDSLNNFGKLVLMITKARKNFLDLLDDNLNYRISVGPEELEYLFDLQAGVNESPDNISDIVDKILGLYGDAQLWVGRENSRVLYVRVIPDERSQEGLAGFVTTMDKLAKTFKADEFNLITSMPMMYRFWWD